MDAYSDNVTKVTIPIPLPPQNNFGVHATSHHSAVRLMQRMNKEQFELIRKQAVRLQITVAQFIKESAVNMAKALEQMEKDDAKHDLRSG